MNTMREPSPAQAQFVWSLVPADCKRAITQLQRLGLMDIARADVLREAAAALERIGGAKAELDYCWALEHAAERWLKAHGGEIANRQSAMAEGQKEAA